MLAYPPRDSLGVQPVDDGLAVEHVVAVRVQAEEVRGDHGQVVGLGAGSRGEGEQGAGSREQEAGMRDEG